MDLVNASENATASTVRKKKGTTVRKGEGKKEGRSTGYSLEESQKGSTYRYGEVEEKIEGNNSSVYGSVM